MCIVDAIWKYGGLISAWNPLNSNFIYFLTSVGILLERTIKNWDSPLKLINCYGPYIDCGEFWEAVIFYGIFSESTLR